MGEVIHIDFGDQQPQDEPNCDFGDRQPQDEPIKSKHDQILDLVNFSLDGRSKKLMNLEVSLASLEQSYKIIKDYTIEELFDWLETTNEGDWKKKPAFFQAIFKELTLRLRVISEDFLTQNEKTLTFEEFSVSISEDMPRYNNFYGYWSFGSIGEVYSKTDHYKRFAAEHPELDADLKQHIQGILQRLQDGDDHREKSIAMHDCDELLYKAYLIMRDYGISHHDLFS